MEPRLARAMACTAPATGAGATVTRLSLRSKPGVFPLPEFQRAHAEH